MCCGYILSSLQTALSEVMIGSERLGNLPKVPQLTCCAETLFPVYSLERMSAPCSSSQGFLFCFVFPSDVSSLSSLSLQAGPQAVRPPQLVAATAAETPGEGNRNQCVIAPFCFHDE